MLSALLAATVVLTAAPPVRADRIKDDVPPLAFDLPGRVFAATKLVDPSEPLGTEGQAMPLPGATAKVFYLNELMNELTVDETGRFVVPKGTTGTHVEVTAPGRETARAWIHDVEDWVNVPASRSMPSYTHPQRVKQKIDPKTGLLFLLRRTAKFTGRVVDGAGKPLAGATVRVRAEEGIAGAMKILRNEVEMVTAADGAFALDFAPGKIAVDARAGSNLCVNTIFLDNVAPGALVANLELVIKKRISFQVRVTRNGEPVEKAEVRRCIPTGTTPDEGWSGDEAETDANGIATFERPVEGERASMVARHPIGGIAWRPLEPIPAAGSLVELKLADGATIQGFVKDTAGVPVEGVELDFTQGDPLPHANATWDPAALRCAAAILDEIHTNAQGYFRRSDLVHRLSSWGARKKGYAREHEWSVPKGDLQIVMRPEGSLRGRIRRADSGPLPGMGGSIIAVRQNSTHSTAASDDAYKLDLPPGVWTVHYRDVNGKTTKPVSITVGDVPIELDFDAPE